MRNLPIVRLIITPPLEEAFAALLTRAGFALADDKAPPDVILTDGQGDWRGAARNRSGPTLPPVMFLVRENLPVADYDGIIDSLTLPLKAQDLFVRLRSLVRKSHMTATDSFFIGSVAFNPATRSLAREGQDEQRLTEREAAILSHLLRLEGETAPRGALLQAILGYSPEAETHTLETHIYRIRQKLAQLDTEAAARLLAEDGGYRLKSAVV